MAVRRLQFTRKNPEADVVDQVAEHVLTGGMAVVPTDTVYGIIGDATAKPVAEAICALKNRPGEEALPVFVDHASSLVRWHIKLPDKYLPVTEAFWPGPLTLILPSLPDFYLAVGGDGKSVGVRETAESIVYKVMRKTNRYLFATSANPSNEDPKTVNYKSWLESATKATVIWCEPNNEYQPQDVSTVLNLTGRTPTIKRQGAISVQQLQKIIPNLKVPE